MAEHYEVEPLTGSQVSQAFPLLRGIRPGTSLAAWSRFAEDMGEGVPSAVERRVMVLRSSAGWLFGMFSYLVVPHLGHGRVLEVDNVALVDLGNRRSLSRVLLGGIDTIARRHGCGAVHYRLSPGQDFLVDAIAPAVVEDALRCEDRPAGGRWICRIL